jgi:hypothetical protein
MMGFASPALLLIGISVAVPLILHLLQRQQGPRVVFPALRYLRRAEKENARRIKLRQILLMALRMAALVLLALAAARPFVRSGGAGHEPTAVAIVLDNSLSTGVIHGERRLFDELQERALETLAQARPEDRFWLIRAGAPWEPATPGTAEEIAEQVRRTNVTAGDSDLGAALTRARSLLAAGAEGRRTEIHLLTDLQGTAFRGATEPGAGAPPVVVWAPKGPAPENAAITAVEVGGGLPPRAGERATVSAFVTGSRGGDTIPVRLAIADRIVGAASAPSGTAVLLPFPARSPGVISGWVELDPDALRGDDRRYFVTRVQPPPAVALGERVPFVDEALDVLAEAGRVRRSDPASADVVVAPGGAGAQSARGGKTIVVLAPTSPLELPAANRRLADRGIPWRFTAPSGTGEARLDVETGSDALAGALEDARIREAYGLEREASAGADSVLLRLRDGAPWVIRGDLPEGGRYILVASPLSTEASTLPTSPGLLPLLDRLIGAWAATTAERYDVGPGESLPLPTEATEVLRPDGGRDPVVGGGVYRVPGEPGIYQILAGERVLSAFAVNPSPSESDLARIDDRRLRAALPGWELKRVDDPGDWTDAIFRTRHGREVWRPLVLIALAVLLIEGLVAATGRSSDAPAQRDRSAGLSRPRVAASGAGTGAPTPKSTIS